MKTCVCDVCGQSLSLDNWEDATILGVPLDLCPECHAWAEKLFVVDMLEMMLEGFRARRSNRRAENGLSSPRAAMPDPPGGNARPPAAGTGGGEPSCAGPRQPAQEEVSPPVSDSGNKPITGPGAALKRAVLNGMEAWRKERGLGGWMTLAQKAGVTDADIANMRQRMKVPMETWKKVALALGIKEEEYT